MKLKRIWKIFGGLLLFFILIIISLLVLYNYELSAYDKKDNTDIAFTISSGTSTKEIAKNLEEANLIHSKEFFVIYLKLNNVNNIKASTYSLKRSMDLKKIVEIISSGNGYNPDEISLTFKEGKNLRSIATVISKNTNNSYDDVIKKATDEEYVNSLIEKYWFINDSVKNNDIFYPIEGYLYPETYRFKNKDVSIETIFSKMLDQEDKILSKYKSEIDKNSMSPFEVITFASVVELEASRESDMPNVASVFYNRINKGMSLGSDVTACYAQKIDDPIKCHNTANFNYNSKYNTRLLSLKGLPVGPICNPSEASIKAVLNAPKTNYLYFISDKNTKMYFFENQTEFSKKIAELKKNGDWL